VARNVANWSRATASKAGRLLRGAPSRLKAKTAESGNRRKITIGVVVVALAAVVASVNDVFDLVGNVDEATAEEPSIEATYRSELPSAADPDPEATGEETDPLVDGGPDDVGMDQSPDCGTPAATPEDGGSMDQADSSSTYEHGPLRYQVQPEVVDQDPAQMTVPAIGTAGVYTTGLVILDIVISNPTEQAMTVHGMALEVDRQPVPAGTLWIPFGMDTPGIPTTNLSFDLNEAAPEAATMASGCVLSDRYFESNQILIDPGGTELIKVALSPGQCLCLVRTVIEYAHDNEWKQLTVPGADAPAVPVAGYAESGFQMVYAPSNGALAKYDCRTGPVHSECVGA
jgi:hypothetical protein